MPDKNQNRDSFSTDQGMQSTGSSPTSAQYDNESTDPAKWDRKKRQTLAKDHPYYIANDDQQGSDR